MTGRDLWVNPDVAGVLRLHGDHGDRLLDVLCGVAQGHTYAEIADLMGGRAAASVGDDVRRLMVVLGARDRSNLVFRACDCGLLRNAAERARLAAEVAA